MQQVDDKGYLVVAVNNSDTDYIACARCLAKSLKHWHPDAKICLATDQPIDDDVFDYIRVLPYASELEWKLDLDWQIFYTTPFHETIKLEADLLITGPIDHWWTLLRQKDLVFSTDVVDHRGQISNNRMYRRIFDLNMLPNAYNAITYWRYSRNAEMFFNTVKDVFAKWPIVQENIKSGAHEVPNTDLAYALSADLLGRENFILPGVGPMMVHMKPGILGTNAEDWSKELTWEIDRGTMRVNGYTQSSFFHYQQKHLAKEFVTHYE